MTPHAFIYYTHILNSCLYNNIFLMISEGAFRSASRKPQIDASKARKGPPEVIAAFLRPANILPGRASTLVSGNDREMTKTHIREMTNKTYGK